MRNIRPVISATIIIGVIVGAITMITSTMGFKRTVNNFKADTIGLEREVTIYDYNGGVLEEYEGRIVVDGNGERTKLTFSDMKSVIVDGGIVITKTK